MPPLKTLWFFRLLTENFISFSRRFDCWMNFCTFALALIISWGTGFQAIFTFMSILKLSWNYFIVTWKFRFVTPSCFLSFLDITQPFLFTQWRWRNNCFHEKNWKFKNCEKIFENQKLRSISSAWRNCWSCQLLEIKPSFMDKVRKLFKILCQMPQKPKGF